MRSLNHYSLRRVYYGLLVLRACFALFGTGYIHPDEYFQNGEVTAGWLFNWHALRTWEWEPGFPVRSILPPLTTTGIPFLLAKMTLNKQTIGPSLVFRLERLSFFGISLLMDYAVSSLVHTSPSRMHALVLLGSSHVMHTFQVRPFSTSIEAALVALSFVAFRSYTEATRNGSNQSVKSSRVQLHILAVLFVLGAFTRITFLAFTLPIAWQLLRLIFTTTGLMVESQKRNRSPSLHSQAKILIKPGLTAASVALVIVLADTRYFVPDFSTFAITPINFLLYNLSPGNLAEHGIHSRWLHLLVNMPMMVGPHLIWLGILAGTRLWKSPGKKENVNMFVDRTMVYSFSLSLAVLSIQPHQEPRFLTAIMGLFVVLVANSGYLLHAGRIFWTTWALFNILVTLFFGIFHQGGVVPSLFYLHDQIAATDPSDTIHILYWKTYMPPWHLLGINAREVEAGRIIASDLAGAPSHELYKALIQTSTQTSSPTGGGAAQEHSSYQADIVYVVSPFAMVTTLPVNVTSCFSLDYRVFPHLDMDHIGESLEVGPLAGLSLGVWKVDSNCMTSAMASANLD